MVEKKQDHSLDLGIYSRGTGRAHGISLAEVIAAILSIAWIAAVVVFLLATKSVANASRFEPVTFGVTLLTIFLPIALIWVAALAARSARIMREETARLQASIDVLRQAYVSQQQGHGLAPRPSAEKKPAESTAGQREPETALAMFSSRRDSGSEAHSGTKAALGKALPPAPDEPFLELGTPAEDSRAPLTVAEFVSALNFPKDPEDKEGFRTLRRALEDREIARLVRAAEDVLTLLSQEGIYMDDLRPDRAKPEVWRRFAKGERGRTIAALGGIRDRSCLALSTGRMHNDPVFRDAVHHFLRQFDKTFTAFEAGATDQDIAALAETRSARAFMLLGRVAGTFD